MAITAATKLSDFSGLLSPEQSRPIFEMAARVSAVQSLVQHMRSEQQMIRTWVENQADQNRELKKTLDRLVAEKERH